MSLVVGTAANAQGGPQSDQPAQASGQSDAALAQQLANPVSSLISFPLQLNYDCCVGPNDSGRYVLNVQPVVPLTLNENWNLIIRTILPVMHQDVGFGDQTGLGDTTQSFFFSPRTGSKLVWAIGPVIYYPTGTDGFSGAKWGAGPTALVLKEAGGGNTYGILANHISSFAGADSRPDISTTFLQPFFSHTFANATGVSVNTETSYDWENEQWTVPLNVSVNRVFNWSGQRVQLALGGKTYIDGREDASDWGVRFTTTLLFPLEAPQHVRNARELGDRLAARLMIEAVLTMLVALEMNSRRLVIFADRQTAALAPRPPLGAAERRIERHSPASLMMRSHKRTPPLNHIAGRAPNSACSPTARDSRSRCFRRSAFGFHLIAPRAGGRHCRVKGE